MRTKQELVNDLFWRLRESNTAKTRREICEMLGYSTKSPAPHIIHIIEVLVNEHMLIKVPYTIPNGITGNRYFVNELEAEKLESKSSPTP